MALQEVSCPLQNRMCSGSLDPTAVYNHVSGGEES